MDLIAKHTAARLAGFSWDDIHGYLDQKNKEAKDAGYSQEEINAFHGFQDPSAMTGRLNQIARATMNEMPDA
jgi:hypothetical protein